SDSVESPRDHVESPRDEKAIAPVEHVIAYERLSAPSPPSFAPPPPPVPARDQIPESRAAAKPQPVLVDAARPTTESSTAARPVPDDVVSAPAAPSQPAVVLPLSRSPIRADQTPPPLVDDPMMSGLDRLLRVAAARGASTLYLSSESRP